MTISMQFVVEDGTGKSDATSYASVDNYKQYWYNRLGSAVTTTDTLIQAYLNTATEYIDLTYRFAGCPANDDQALEWPRYDVLKNGLDEYVGTDEIPQALIDATCYLANEVKTGQLNQVNENIRSESWGPVSKSYANGGMKEYPAVNKMFRYFLLSGAVLKRVN